MMAALGAAGISALGGIASSAMSIREARKNRQWQERMSNTAHQREVKDLKKAGLNPILSVNKSGATTPGGAMGTITNSAKDAVDSYNQTKLIKAQIDNIKMDTSLKHEQADLTNFQQGKLGWEVEQLKNQIKLIQNNARGTDLDNALKQIDVDMFSEAEILKNAKSLGIKPETFKGLLNVILRK